MSRVFPLLGVFALSLLATLAEAGSWKAQVMQLSDGVQPSSAQVGTNWDARIEYGVASTATDLPRAFANGDERGWSKPVFATLQRRFPGAGMTPYLGVGAGYADGLMRSPSGVAPGTLAFGGTVGTELDLEEGLGAFFEYSIAVAPGAASGTNKSLRRHTISTGITLDLN